VSTTTDPRPVAPPYGPDRPWQSRFLGWVERRKRLSVLVPVLVVVLGTPHSCPFC
jgi:hypothetical protein